MLAHNPMPFREPQIMDISKLEGHFKSENYKKIRKRIEKSVGMIIVE